MSLVEPAVQPESISELEFAARLNLGMRCMLNYRKAGKLPPHFLAKIKGPHPQVRYFLKDAEEYETALKSAQ